MHETITSYDRAHSADMLHPMPKHNELHIVSFSTQLKLVRHTSLGNSCVCHQPELTDIMYCRLPNRLTWCLFATTYYCCKQQSDQMNLRTYRLRTLSAFVIFLFSSIRLQILQKWIWRSKRSSEDLLVHTEVRWLSRGWSVQVFLNRTEMCRGSYRAKTSLYSMFLKTFCDSAS